MRNFLFVLLFSFTSIVNAQTPRAGGINNLQATVLPVVHDNFVGVQTTNLNAFAVYSFNTNFDNSLGLKTTDNITEGSVNKYFSNILARNAFGAGTGLTYLNGLYSLDSSTQGILASVANKFNNPLGTGLQYLNGLGVPTIFPTIPAAQIQSDWNAVSGVNQILNKPAIINYSAGPGIQLSSGVFSNTSPDQTVVLTGGNRTLITGTYPNFTISFIEPTINIIASKTLNSNYTISATKQANVSYSLTCSVTNPLLAGSSTANIFLEYSTNGGSTWLLPSQNGNLSSVALAVAVAITNSQTVTVAGSIPAGALVRLRTTTTGTASVTYVTGTEIY